MRTDMRLRRRSTTRVEELISPTAADALAALALLDGLESSELSVTDDLTAGIFAVGGPDRFLCWVQRWGPSGELDFDNAVDPAAVGPLLNVTLSNGQVDQFPVSRTIDRAAVARALRSFVDDGSLDASIEWVGIESR